MSVTSRRSKLASACILAAALVASGLALAQNRTTASELSACVASDSSLRFAPRAQCAAGERLLTWNVRGLDGPVGPLGPRGPAGPIGSINNVSWSDLPFVSKHRFEHPDPLPTSVGTPGIGSDCMLGEVRLFAGSFAPTGWTFALGQQLPVSTHSALFAVLGISYGGDGRSTFALPNLTDLQPDGVAHIICTGGTPPPRL